MKKTVLVGDAFPRHEFETMRGETITVPDAVNLTHFQLRRFAGCPICNLHLRSVVQRHDEIREAGIREVVVFHSTKDDLLAHEDYLPFDVVPDPGKQIYRELGVEPSLRSIVDRRMTGPIVRGLARSLGGTVRRRQRMSPVAPKGGPLGLPADLLIGTDGRVVAAKYGEHAFDQWSVDELLVQARSAADERP